MSSTDVANGEPKYARFTRRLQAVMIDSIAMSLLLVVALLLAVAFESNNIGRALGFSVAAILLLYEPILVSLTGSTLGHFATNLRVIDDNTHKNLSFPKAIARTVIKTGLGLYSFITMAFTRRHQSMHDILTGSTVQIRDPSKARPYHYTSARSAVEHLALPSSPRRIAVILIYVLALTTVLFYGLDLVLRRTTALSAACLDHDTCSIRETVFLYGIPLAWFVLVALCVIQGWRGQLWGARRNR